MICHYGTEGNISDGIAIVRVPSSTAGVLVEAPAGTELLVRDAGTLAEIKTGLLNQAGESIPKVLSEVYGRARVIIDADAPPDAVDVSGDGGENWTRLYAIEAWERAFAASTARQTVRFISRTGATELRIFDGPTQPVESDGLVPGARHLWIVSGA